MGPWRWPTDGRVTRGFGSGNKGVDFSLVRGSTVNAAAAGEIVYAGGGLRGYRSLVIIKHDPHYLSAYSLNHEITVREGQRIKLGGLLAKVERPVGLHFEIRRDGDPVNPGRLIGG
jgi:lipoprotein NlpD